MLGVRFNVPRGAYAVTVFAAVGSVIIVALAILGKESEGIGAIGLGRGKGAYPGNVGIVDRYGYGL